MGEDQPTVFFHNVLQPDNLYDVVVLDILNHHLLMQPCTGSTRCHLPAQSGSLSRQSQHITYGCTPATAGIGRLRLQPVAPTLSCAPARRIVITQRMRMQRTTTSRNIASEQDQRPSLLRIEAGLRQQPVHPDEVGIERRGRSPILGDQRAATGVSGSAPTRRQR
tara:strand:+ start:56 stop:550 length:495 start_codon:yes stop_codon:yes gene_type:complete